MGGTKDMSSIYVGETSAARAIGVQEAVYAQEKCE